MEMIKVTSSNINAIGWQGNVLLDNGFIPKDILRVQYSHGAIYDYVGVTKEVFDQLMQAESKGSFLNKNIKDKYQTIGPR